MEDNQIIKLFWNRDETAIAETRKKYGSYCHAIAQNILHNQEDSDECVNDIESYIVLLEDNYPAMARITYIDGSTFNKRYGSGDISGIYGGVFAKTEQVNHIEVNYYTYTAEEGTVTSYAIWENDGFTYSLASENTTFEQLSADNQTLMK